MPQIQLPSAGACRRRFVLPLLCVLLFPVSAAAAPPAEPARTSDGTATANTATATAADPAETDDGQRVKFYGPLRIRDLMPLTLLFLDFVPSHAVEGSEGLLFVEFHHSHANTFIKSGNVRDYLEARNVLGRQPLRDRDIAEILAFDDDAFYFDGAAGYANITFHYSFGRDWYAYLKVPFIYYDGGLLDDGIESFHNSFGFSNAGRELVPRNRTQVLVKLGDESLVLPDDESISGLADPVLALSHALRRSDGWSVVLEGAVKLPVASTSDFLSSGATDFGLQVSLHKQWRERALYLALSHVWLGDSDELPGFDIADIQKVTASYEHLLGRRWSWLLQGSVSPSPFDATDSELSEARLQLSIGLRYAYAENAALELGITENLSNYDSTPDIGLHFGIGTPLARLR